VCDISDAAGTATNPGITNQNATGIASYSTGAIQNICFSKKLTYSLFQEPSK